MADTSVPVLHLDNASSSMSTTSSCCSAESDGLALDTPSSPGSLVAAMQCPLTSPSMSTATLVDAGSQVTLERMSGLNGERLKISLFTIGSRGDVQPMIALGKALQSRGHICTIATHKEYEPWILSHGLKFAQIAGNPAEIMQLCVDNGLFTVSFVREAYSKFREWIDDLFHSTYVALRGSDVVIESVVSLAGYHVAQKLEVPYFASCPMPWTRTSEFPHPFAISDYLEYGYNRMSWILLENVLWKGLRPQCNQFRQHHLNIEPIYSGNWFAEERIPFLYCFSPNVVKKPAEWRSHIHLTGNWFLNAPDSNWAPSDELLGFLNDRSDGKPVVYIGFGSIVVPDPNELTRIIIEAVHRAGVRAVISKGWSARGQKEEVHSNDEEQTLFSSNIFFLNSVPHDWLFPQMDAVIHHGGAGTTAAGLRFGIPTVIRPFFGDQFFWASRVSNLGVGCAIRKLEIDTLSESIKKVTKDSNIKARARTLGEKMQLENGVETAVEIIHAEIPILRKKIQDRIHGRKAMQNAPAAKSYTQRIKDTITSATRRSSSAAIESAFDSNHVVEMEMTDLNASFKSMKAFAGMSGNVTDTEEAHASRKGKSYKWRRRRRRNSQEIFNDQVVHSLPSSPFIRSDGNYYQSDTRLALSSDEELPAPRARPFYQHRATQSESGLSTSPRPDPITGQPMQAAGSPDKRKGGYLSRVFRV
eukprot:Partr_v1_DN28319_c0_g1_i1_m78867 putative May be involved in decane metabolism and autophagy. Involved in the biosynthesis of sterol glucoside (By similarity)